MKRSRDDMTSGSQPKEHILNEMKRSRDDLLSGWQPKKPKLKKPSRALTEENAKVFFQELQKTFKYEKDKLHMLDAVVKDKREKRIGPVTFTARVQDIIKGHTNLTHMFNVGLPEKHEMYLRGFVFCEKVEKRLGSEEEFQKFTDILYSMRSVDTITNEKHLSPINSILGNHQDLMDEFNELLRTGYIEMRRNGDDLPSGSQSPSETREMAFVKEIVETFKDDKEKLDMYLALCDEGLVEPYLLLERHNNLIDQFNSIFPRIDKNHKGYVFCEKLYERLSIDELRKFKDMLFSVESADTITRQKIVSEMNSILVEHQDLMVEFNELLEINCDHLWDCLNAVSVYKRKAAPAS